MDGNMELETNFSTELISTDWHTLPTDALYGMTAPESTACEIYNIFIRIIFGSGVVIFGLVGNGLTIAIMAADRHKSATILLLFYLAMLDSLVLLVYGSIAVPTPVLKSLGRTSEASKLQMYCIAYASPLGQMFNLMSVLVTVIVTWQRYLSVCRPHNAKTYGSVKKTNILVAAAVIFSVLFNLPQFFHYRVRSDHPLPGKTAIVTTTFAQTETYRMVYSVLLCYMVSYILPMIALIYMTCSLIRALRASNKKKETSIGKTPKEELTLSLIIVVILFIICQSIGPVRRILMGVYDPYREAIQCSGSLFYFGPIYITSLQVNSAVNFVIYVLFARGFRKKLGAFFTRKTTRIAPVLNEPRHQLDSFHTHI